jgi:aryl-alcohol dehydrogenase-like predicted oxidoreductase
MPRMPAGIVLGTMSFGHRTAEPGAVGIMERAVAAGLTRFDTANVCADGLSEPIVGRFLGSPGTTCQVAKVGLARPRERVLPDPLRRAVGAAHVAPSGTDARCAR